MGVLADSGTSLTDALSNIGTVLTQVTSTITGNAVLFTMFAGGLMVVGARVFKRIKNASK